MTRAQPRYRMVDFSELPGVACPCGIARRAFADVPEFPGTFHVTEITGDARRHYHRAHTETYYILECDPDAALELDGEVVPVRPGSCIVIPPGVRHRGIGCMRIINVVLPKFDPDDEHYD
jgi:mannose-6-phosphate isomerase-like protein (cupin superfamily)